MATQQVHRPDKSDRVTRGALRVALLIALLASAAFALLGHPQVVAAVRSHQLPAEWLLLGPGLFLVFVLVSIVDAAVVARRRGFLSGRALLQVLLALGFVAFLVPQAYGEYRARKSPPTTSVRLLEQLARHNDARVRAVVIDLAGYRTPEPELARLLLIAFDDKDPMVREAAFDAFQRRWGGSAKLEREEAIKIVKGWLGAPSGVSP